MGLTDQTADAIAAAASACVFCAIFGATWALNSRYGEHTFETFSSRDKAEWCRRTCSAFHASIVFPGVAICLIDASFSDDSIAFSSPLLCRFIFSASIGYFAEDAAVAFLWRLRRWKATLAYHLLAVVPLAVNNFVPGCHCGSIVLALFLLVQVPTMPLNLLEAALPLLGGESACRSPLTFSASLSFYIMWFLMRVALPTYALGLLYDVVVPAWYSERSTSEMWVCVLPAAACTNVVSFFSFYAFFTHLSASLLATRRHGSHSGGGKGMSDGNSSSSSSRNGSSWGGTRGAPGARGGQQRPRRSSSRVAAYGAVDEWLLEKFPSGGGAGGGGGDDDDQSRCTDSCGGCGEQCGGSISDDNDDSEEEEEEAECSSNSYTARLLGGSSRAVYV